ncbi:MAG: glycosyltransferase [Patescibacteria group bacterium]|jgi:glycosyltransferase involved in cell wall biosynthesis
MKVAILNNLYPPNGRGGAEEAARNQANTFCVQGDTMIVLTLSPVNKLVVREDNGVKIYELPHKNIFNYFHIGRHSAPMRFLWHIIDTFNFCLARDIGKILKAESADLAVCHNMKGLSYLTPRLIGRLGIKQWQVMHDVQLYTPSGLIAWGKEKSFEHAGLPTRAYRFFIRRFFSYAEKVFFPSKWLMEFYVSNGFFKTQEKIYQPNEINFLNSHCEERNRDAAISSAGFFANNQQSTINNFLYVGQLEPHKGVMLLLDAFLLLPNGAQLHIVGDGSLMAEVKKRTDGNPNIIVYGRVAREKLPEFYSRAKAVIVPSLVYENAPMVIGEALSCGAKVIVARLGGAPELIKERENGVIFTPGDANDLAEKMKKFI